jgi:hypothetical protein
VFTRGSIKNTRGGKSRKKEKKMSDEVTPTPIIVPVKPGYKTTEFWLSTASTVVSLAIASDIIPTEGIWPKIVGLVVAVLGTLGYTVMRGAAKKV